MPARPFIGDRELHLIAKLLSAIDDDMLLAEGFSPEERARADWLFDDLDKFLTHRVGEDWALVPVQEG